MKKELISIIILSLLILPLASASLTITKNEIVNAVVPETKQPAIFDLTLTNNGVSDTFTIYSIVGVNILPEEPFTINTGETKTIQIQLMPEKAILNTPGTFNFMYKIKGQTSGIQDDVLTIRIVPLKDAIEINSYNINLDSDTATVYIKNTVNLPFPSVKANIHSAFFDFSKTVSLTANDKQEFSITLNKDQVKSLVAGSYITTADIETYNVKARTENSFKYSEKESVITTERKSGFIISTLIIDKNNEGNLPAIAQVAASKNILSRLFTTFNIEPTKTTRSGLSMTYLFQKEIRPGESLTVKVTTNWIYPLILLIAIGIIAYLVYMYTTTSLLIRKKATYVKTTSGDFALKITITARAKRFVEKVNLIDRLPPLVKIHEKFPGRAPDRLDTHNGRLEWYIDTLQVGEERVFSYIIFSKVAPLGKFELPTTVGVYEKDGKIHESASNKVFFFTEPRKSY